MAKIVLSDGTDGARKKIIARLKSELTHAFLHVASSPLNVSTTLTQAQLSDVSSDTVGRVRELTFTGSETVFLTGNNITNDNLITLFWLLSGRNVDKLVLVKPSGSDWRVNGIITFDTISTSENNQPYFLREIKIEVLDQA